MMYSQDAVGGAAPGLGGIAEGDIFKSTGRNWGDNPETQFETSSVASSSVALSSAGAYGRGAGGAGGRKTGHAPAAADSRFDKRYDNAVVDNKAL